MHPNEQAAIDRAMEQSRASGGPVTLELAGRLREAAHFIEERYDGSVDTSERDDDSIEVVGWRASTPGATFDFQLRLRSLDRED